MLRGTLTSATIVVTLACSTADSAPETTPTTRAVAPPKAEEPACDPGKVAALATSLNTDDEALATGLADACRLPPAIVSFLQRTDASQLRKLAVIDADLRTQLTAALAAVCPGFAVIEQQLEQSPIAARMGLLYERCNFKRFALLDQASFVRGDPSSTVPWFAYDWLRKQSIPVAQAKTIGLALIRRDRRDWGLPEQTLPRVDHPLPMVPPAAAIVHVTTAAILVDDKTLATLDKDGTVRGQASEDDHVIEALHQTLAARPPEAREHPLVLVMDTTTSVRTLIGILHTGQRAAFTEFALVATNDTGDFGAVVVHADAPRPQHELEFTVWMDARGFGVRPSTQSRRRRIDTDPEQDTAPNYALLAETATKHMAEYPKTGTARITAEWTLEVGPVVAAAAAVRGEACHSTGRCILPRIAIAAAASAKARRRRDVEEVVQNKTVMRVLGAYGDGSSGALFDVIETRDDTLAELFAKGRSDAIATQDARRPRVQWTKSAADGGLVPEVVRRTVRGKISTIRTCYADGVADDSAASADLTLSLTIAADGDVTSATATSIQLGPTIRTCMEQAAQRWAFPAASNGAETTAAIAWAFSME